MAHCTDGGVGMNINRIYVSDTTWVGGHYFIPWAPPLRVRDVPENWDGTTTYQRIAWPLPRHRVYEVTVIGDTTYIFLRASAFRPAPPTLRVKEEPDA